MVARNQTGDPARRAAPGRLAAVVALPRRPLQLPAPPSPSKAAVPTGGRPAAPATVPAGQRPVRAAVRAGRRSAPPLRLTRRGRVVLAVFTALAALVLVMLLAAGTAGGAPLTGHRPAGGGYQGMTQIVVQPGQSMWSIAASADPAADPRVVIQQIISANSLTGTSIRAGQLLWVPKPS
jgi:hypothetical protein